MGCDGNNATPPTPAIAPASGSEPPGGEIDPRRVAEELARANGPGGIDPRVPELVPGFDAPFYQAGLAGYSDAAMRIVARRHGCPFCVTEALLDRALIAGGRGFTKADLGALGDNVPGGDEDFPLSGQIMGSDPKEMAAAALKMVEQGSRNAWEYRKYAYDGRRAPDGGKPSAASDQRSGSPVTDHRLPGSSARGFATIDVNLACPVKKVKTKARGGHWLAEPDGAIRILEAVREVLPAEVLTTVKMRRAFDDTPEQRESFWRIFDAAYDMGYSWATVHGRTVAQKYVGPSRWDELRDIVRQRPGRIVFGSGDIWTAGDVFRMIRYTGVTGASVARGCIGNPWIFKQCRELLAGREPTPPTIADQRVVLEQHFGLALSVNASMRNGELSTAKMMRKFGIRFAAHHPNPREVKKQMIAVETLDDWRGVLEEMYVDEAVSE